MFKRIANLFRGFIGLFVSGMEKRAPEALLEVEKENLRKQIAKYNQGLAAHAGLCENLMSQIRRLEAQERDLRAKASANLRAGNGEAAGRYALELQNVQRELTDNRTQLGQAETTSTELISARDVSVKAARDKIESLRRGLDDLKVQKAQAELSEMASGMINSIGGSGDTLNRLHEMVEQERSQAAGRARIARDSIDTTDFKMKESEQKALEAQALADFAAREGMSVPSVPGAITPEAPAADAARKMGPQGESV